MTDSIQKLSKILSSIQDTAFKVHEKMEAQDCIPLMDFEHYIFNDREVSIETRTHILWPLLIFTQARVELQSEFQNNMSLKLKADASFIVRQLICTQPKVWSYRLSYQRGFAHTVTGPNMISEISIDGCLSIVGELKNEDHLYLIGWTLSFMDKMFLICAHTLTQEQVYQIDPIHPFPLQLDDDNYWEENFLNILRTLYEEDRVPRQKGITFTRPRLTSYSPEFRYSILNRILITSNGSQLTKGLSLQDIVATHSPEDIVAIVTRIVEKQTTQSSNYTAEEMIHRVLQCIGCDDNGMIPSAHPSLLGMDPLCLLLLPENTPVLQKLNGRDSIKQALNHPDCTDEVKQAFEIYQREKRWMAAFACFDLSIESHAVNFGIPINSLERNFSPQLFSSKLPIVPQGDLLKQLQNRYHCYESTDEFPTFKSVLKWINGGLISKTGNMSNIAKWIMSCCERYRYCLTQIEPDIGSSQRSIDKNNQSLLQKGLNDLARMFGKK